MRQHAIRWNAHSEQGLLPRLSKPRAATKVRERGGSRRTSQSRGKRAHCVEKVMHAARVPRHSFTSLALPEAVFRVDDVACQDDTRPSTQMVLPLLLADKGRHA